MSAPLRLDRRNLLRAVGLASGSLFLPSCLGKRAAPPRRLLIVYSYHGTHHAARRLSSPRGDGADWSLDLTRRRDPEELSTLLRPLFRHRHKLSVIDGLSMATAHADPGFDPHQTGHVHSLTGAESDSLSATRITATAPSMDQIVASAVRRPDALPSLELAPHPPYHGGPCYSAAGVQLPFESSPVAAFHRLFPEPSGAEASVLDALAAEYEHQAARLPPEDRRKLDLHRDLVRDLERRTGAVAALSCARPELPEALPGRVDGDEPDAYRLRCDALFHLVTAAFSCDLTRVATLVLTQIPNAQINAPPGDIHADFAHNSKDDPKAAKVMTDYHAFHASQTAQLLDLLDSIPEPGEASGGTLLDNTLVLRMSELGSGWHDYQPLPVLVAGGGGALPLGRYIHYAPTLPDPSPRPPAAAAHPVRLGPPHNTLLVSICRAMGLERDHVGARALTTREGRRLDLTGPLTGLA